MLKATPTVIPLAGLGFLTAMYIDCIKYLILHNVARKLKVSSSEVVLLFLAVIQ